ncbi:MAG TPA: hypothetical protein PLU78_06555, partial [Chitinophagales bacterium]|nr:hypothetical protein [Chitinophagales bacterium]
MNKFIRDILRRKILADGQDKSGKKLSGQEINKRIEILSIGLKRETKDALFILAGIFSAGFGLRGFLLPNNFID